METFVLMATLCTSCPTERMIVKNCDAGVSWIREARRWAERSGMSAMEPMYMCYPAMFELETVSQ